MNPSSSPVAIILLLKQATALIPTPLKNVMKIKMFIKITYLLEVLQIAFPDLSNRIVSPVLYVATILSNSCLIMF